MCGRYTIGVTKKEIIDRFDIQNDFADLKPSYNVAPGTKEPVVYQENVNKVEYMRWGLIPFWAQDPRIGYKMINARAETVADKPSFRKAFKTQRCIVPATGFYEWKIDGKDKIPYFIHLKNKKLFGFAGLYDKWKDSKREIRYARLPWTGDIYW